MFFETEKPLLRKPKCRYQDVRTQENHMLSLESDRALIKRTGWQSRSGCDPLITLTRDVRLPSCQRTNLATENDPALSEIDAFLDSLFSHFANVCNAFFSCSSKRAYRCGDTARKGNDALRASCQLRWGLLGSIRSQTEAKLRMDWYEMIWILMCFVRTNRFLKFGKAGSSTCSWQTSDRKTICAEIVSSRGFFAERHLPQLRTKHIEIHVHDDTGIP